MGRRNKRRGADHHRPLTIRSTHWRADGRAKQRYHSSREAQLAANDRSAEAGYLLHVYQCDFCKGWHMARSGDD
jgi:hypothetical protein